MIEARLDRINHLLDNLENSIKDLHAYVRELENALLAADDLLGQADFKNGNAHMGTDEGETLASHYQQIYIEPVVKRVRKKREVLEKKVL